jgi:biopolymer transport protein ExbB/TolQ
VGDHLGRSRFRPSTSGQADHSDPRETAVKTWLIVLIIVVVVVVLALIALLAARRSRVAGLRKREQARGQLQESRVLGAQAEQEQALAEEQAARARRELAEAQERAARAEVEARERAGLAEEHRASAQELHAKAEKAAPDLTAENPRGDGGATRR